MTLATQTLTLDLRPAYNTRGVVRCSQYDDVLRSVTFMIQNEGVDIDVSAYTVFIEGTKPDNTGFSYNVRDIGGTVQINQVTVPIQVQMCAIAGMVRAEVIFKNGSERVGSANFFIAVEAAGLDANVDISETEIPAYISAAEHAAEVAQQAQQAAQQILDTSDQALLAAQQAELIAQGALDQAEETAESIPSDYTELSDDVDDLKNALQFGTQPAVAKDGLYVDDTGKIMAKTNSQIFLVDLTQILGAPLIEATITGTHNRCRLLLMTANIADVVSGTTGTYIEKGNATTSFALKYATYRQYKTLAICTNYQSTPYATLTVQTKLDISDVAEIKEAVDAVAKLETENIPLRWEQGTLNSGNGGEVPSTTKIRTQAIDISKYTSVTFNNTSGYKFRTAWLNSSGAVVKDAAYEMERTVTSVSYGFMQRYNITAVRVVLGKTSDADIVPSEGSALTITGVMEIETKVDRINKTLSNDYKYAGTDYKQVPLTSVDFSVGHINDSGVVVAGYRPYTDFINLDDDMIIKSGTYLVTAFVYEADGTFVSNTGWWSNQFFIPYTADRKIRILFDKEGYPNNSTSPKIDQIINSDLYIGVKRKKEYIEESVSNVLTNMAGQDGNTLNLAFITDLHVTAFGNLPLRQVEVWNRNTNGLACVDESRNIDFVVLGGDYLWNNTNTTLVRAERAYKLLQECFYKFKEKQFALKGNHDDNSIANNSDYIVTDSMRYGYLGQQYTNAVKIKYGNAEKSYGYIDFERKKIRALFINTVDIPSYTGQHITGVSNTQLNFFADALNITENGWAVLVFSHHVLVNNATMATDSEAYLTPTHGGDALWGMIQAFKNKATYSKVSTLTDYEYSVDVDYSNNGSSEVIACINGHTHRDLSATQDGVLLISTTASGFEQTKYDSTGTQITQTLNTQTETSYDIYSFDRINRTIKASRYGAGQNRNWSY